MKTSGNNINGLNFLLGAASLIIILWGISQAKDVIGLILISGFLAILGVRPFFWLISKKVPSALAVLIVIGAMILLFLLFDFLIGLSVKNLIDSLPEYQEKLKEELDNIKDFTAQKGFNINDKDIINYFSTERISGFVTSLMSGMISIISGTVVIFLTVSFVLLESSGFSKKLKVAIGNPRETFPEFSTFIDEIKHYVIVQTLISLATGIVSGIWLAAMGVDFAIMFGLLAYLLNYIPNVGSIIAIVPAVVVALVQNGMVNALIVFVGYLILTLIIGSIIQPRIMGKQLGLSPLVVFLSLIFWGSLLGVIGMVLCVPLTKALKFGLERSESTKWVAILLGRDDTIKRFPSLSRKKKVTADA